jgi:NADH-ubiquinone oxidoreductase chain 5
VPVIFSISGGIIALIIYVSPYGGTIVSPYRWSNIGVKVYTFLSNKWNVDQIYNAYIVKPILNAGHDITYKILDRGIIEILGPTGISSIIKSITANLSKKVQTGEMYNYALTIFVFATLFIAFAALGPYWSILGGNKAEILLILIPVIIALFVGGA